MEATLELRCTVHPTYAAKREPSCDCKACWAKWVLTDNSKREEAVAAPAPTPLRSTQDGDIDVMVAWLNEKHGDHYTYSYSKGRTFYKIIQKSVLGASTSVYAFVAITDQISKGLGKVRAGAILKPAGWAKPAKHERAFLWDQSNWEAALGAYGVAYLR